MSVAVNRTTGQVLTSVHTPNFNEADWIINPTLPNCNQKYRKIDGDNVKEMSASEKAAVDVVAADLATKQEQEILIQNKIAETSRAEAVTTLKGDGTLPADFKG